MHIDPALELALRLGFLALFTVTLVQKLAHPGQLRATVESYLRGSSLARPAVTIIGAAFAITGELGVVVLCATSFSGSQRVAGIAGMLLVYALAMAWNLHRGNRLLDCGCHWGRERQPVSYLLVARNCTLVLASLLLLCPIATRPLLAIDAVTVLASIVVAALAYASVNQINAINAFISG